MNGTTESSMNKSRLRLVTGTLLPPPFAVTRPRTLNPLAWHTFHQKFINAITRIIGFLRPAKLVITVRWHYQITGINTIHLLSTNISTRIITYRG